MLRARRFNAFLFLTIVSFSTGCTKAVEFLTPGVERIRLLLTPSPSGQSARAKGTPTPLPTESEKKRKLELLKEMITVVTLVPPTSSNEFAGWASVVSQGASLEGVYNGLTHSAEQREREKSEPADAHALRAFAQELALLQSDLPLDHVFTPQEAKPLPTVEELRYGEEASPSNAAPNSPEPAPIRLHQRVTNHAELARRYEAAFFQSSLFTLKRVLGDEVLRVIEHLEGSRALLAEWYGDFSARLGKEGVDFGLSKRNLPDAAFHRDWAKSQTDLDFLRWESLNRIHRLLNDRNGKPAKK